MAFITAKRIIQNGRVLREWPVQGSPGTRAHGRQGTDLGLISIQKVLPPGGCFEPALKYKRTVRPSLGGLLPECQLCPGSCPSQGSSCPSRVGARVGKAVQERRKGESKGLSTSQITLSVEAEPTLHSGSRGFV